MNNTVLAHLSGHHQTCIPEPMKETIQIIQLHSFSFMFLNFWLGVRLTFIIFKVSFMGSGIKV